MFPEVTGPSPRRIREFDACEDLEDSIVATIDNGVDLIKAELDGWPEQGVDWDLILRWAAFLKSLNLLDVPTYRTREELEAPAEARRTEAQR